MAIDLSNLNDYSNLKIKMGGVSQSQNTTPTTTTVQPNSYQFDAGQNGSSLSSGGFQFNPQGQTQPPVQPVTPQQVNLGNSNYMMNGQQNPQNPPQANQPQSIAPVAPQQPQQPTGQVGGLVGGATQTQMPQQQAPQQQAPQQQAPAPAQQPQMPPQQGSVAAPPTPNDQAIAQSESGNNNTMGYHYPANANGQRSSTAYGKFGITAPAYRDIQSQDSYFKGKNIESLTPDEQLRANQTYQSVLSKQLQAQGIQPDDKTLRLAHFMGAKGAAQFLKTGVVSSQAAVNNGGEEKVRDIAKKLLNGETPKVSQTTGDEHIDRINQARTPEDHASVISDPNASPAAKSIATDKLLQDQQSKVGQAQAQATIQAAGSGNTKAISDMTRELAKQTNDGSWLKALFYGYTGQRQRAAQEMEKLMPSPHPIKQAMDEKGEPVYIQKNPLTGIVENAYDKNGMKMDSVKAQQYAGMLGLQSTGHIMNSDEGQTEVFKNEEGQNVYKVNGKYTQTAPSGMVPLGSKSGLESQADTSAANLEKILRKRQTEERERGAGDNDLAQQGLDDTSIQQQVDAHRAQKLQSLKASRGQVVTTDTGVTTPTKSTATQPEPDEENPYETNNGKESFLKGWGKYASPSVKNKDQLKREQKVDAETLDNNARMLISGDRTSTNIPAINGERSLSIRRAKELDPDYSETESDSAQAARKEFNTGATGKTIRALNVAVDHIGTVREQIKKLPNGEFTPINQIVNAFAKNTGNKDIGTFDAMAGLLAAEITKAVVANGGSMSEREEKQKILSSAKSPEQLNAILDGYQKLLGGQLNGVKQQYTATGLKNFDKYLTPHAKVALSSAPAEAPAANNTQQAPVAPTKRGVYNPKTNRVEYQ